MPIHKQVRKWLNIRLFLPTEAKSIEKLIYCNAGIASNEEILDGKRYDFSIRQ